jgi:hypothetical protein
MTHPTGQSNYSLPKIQSKSKSTPQPTAASRKVTHDHVTDGKSSRRKGPALSLSSAFHLHTRPHFPPSSTINPIFIIPNRDILAKMHLTPLLLTAATLALTSTALPTGLNTATTEEAPANSISLSGSHGQHRCCPPFKAPRNKHFPPPRLPCDPNCTTRKLSFSFLLDVRLNE